MLIKLSPDKLSETWPLIHKAIKHSSVALADMSEERVNNVLRALMTGYATCWTHEAGNTITTVIITAVVEEPLSKTFNLLIYSAHMFAKIKSDEYIEIAKTLGVYAKSMGCSKVILYCSNNKLVDILTQHGASNLYTLVVFPLL